MAFKGALWPIMSMEHLLDRLTGLSGRGSDWARNLSKNEGTSR